MIACWSAEAEQATRAGKPSGKRAESKQAARTRQARVDSKPLSPLGTALTFGVRHFLS